MLQFLTNLIQFIELIRLPLIVIIMVLTILKVFSLRMIDNQYKQNLNNDSKLEDDRLEN
jgi:hypothetical protein